MNKKVGFIFPGQGAQYPGMGKDFYDQFPVSRNTFEEADTLLGTNFSELIFNGSAAELKLTKNSQLSIFIVSVAILRALQEKFPALVPQVAAGLSLGEYTALVAANKISFKEALFLVKARAEYMNDACLAKEGGMSVILGLDALVVESVIQEVQKEHQVWVANLNCPLQVVIAGTPSGIEAASIRLKEKGAKRILPLEVSGAFHSGLMKPAQDRLEPRIRSAALQESAIALVMNVAGGYVSTLDEMRRNMILQVTHPVRWEQGIKAMAKENVDFFIEMGPGRTLTGMNKKILPSAHSISIEKVSDFALLTEQLQEQYAST